jgi:hypothetical protein
MDLELLFWLQPMVFMMMILFVVITVSCTIALIAYVCSRLFDRLSKDEKMVVDKTIKFLVCSWIISFFVASLMAPVADIDETYKRVLIYRGINSETADKVVSTTDRILELAEKAAVTELEKLGEKE